MNPEKYPPLGRLIDVGGHRLHIHSTGTGSPSVVFESGGASWSLDWHSVQVEAAKFTQVCSYDRAGFGWSDPGPTPRTAGKVAEELHSLLANAGVAKPYILVGASFGGHVARLFAKKYPGETAGVILLDARHEDLDSKMPSAWKNIEKVGGTIYRILLLASRLGLLKALGKFSGKNALPPAAKKLPPDLSTMYMEVGFQSKYFRANLDELAAVRESDRQAAESGPLGNLPLTVIRHGIPDIFSRMPAAEAIQAEQVWQEMQNLLAGLSSDSRSITAENSGHGIQLEQPELVVEAIRQMVDKIRAGR